MEVHLTPDQEAFVQQGLKSGRLHSAEEAVQQAMLLWEERERLRVELLVAIEEADAEFARGESIELTEETTRELAEQIKQHGIASLAAQEKASV